ncbi:MAG: hypothetical protein GWN21_12415 [Gammaproteobacteria bacterium]|nr:hypothetical protein [Gammaproteobacteria bacterium]NIV48389.1 hypothetical protein [Gammaproteobacteria bacterium]NIW56020.1 hypothetical protein [Gammaproteobacteria bacterium]NIX04991.1 hypothetical protein [Gammaproteobacteria bacterium]
MSLVRFHGKSIRVNQHVPHGFPAEIELSGDVVALQKHIFASDIVIAEYCRSLFANPGNRAWNSAHHIRILFDDVLILANIDICRAPSSFFRIHCESRRLIRSAQVGVNLRMRDGQPRREYA